MGWNRVYAEGAKMTQWPQRRNWGLLPGAAEVDRPGVGNDYLSLSSSAVLGFLLSVRVMRISFLPVIKNRTWFPAFTPVKGLPPSLTR